MSRSMNFDVTATDNASREFLTMAQAAERLETKLKQLDRLRIEPTAQLNITPATRSAAQLQSRLNALRNVRASVDITGLAEARRDVTALVVEMRKLRNARVRIDVDGNARTTVTALATQLRTLARDVKVKVSLDDGTFARDIARLHQRVSALRGTTVRIDFDIRPPGIREELNDIAASLRALRGSTTHRVDVDTNSASAAVASLGSALGKLGKTGAVALSIPGIIGLIGQVGSLGASVMSLTGVLGLLPAAGAVGGAALATFGVGLAHVADALGPTGTPAQIKKVEEAMAALSPAAREVVTQIRGLGPAWSDVRLDVQEKLFDDLTDTIGGLANTYLPVLKTGLGGIAEELNEGAYQFAGWLQQGRTVADVNTVLDHTRTTMRELAPAGENVAAALLDVATVGSGIMPELATGATQATGRFREFVAEVRRTGELEQWIRGGIATMEQLGRITLNTGGILGSVFSASETAGYGFLDAVEQVTGELDSLLSSVEGRSALVDTFAESRDAVNALLPGVRELTGATLETVGAFARTDGLESFAALVSRAATAVSPLVSELGELAGGTLGALSGGATIAVGALTPLVALAGGLVDGLGPVAPAVLAAVIAFKGLGLVTPMLAALGARIAATAALSGTLAAGLTGSLAAGAAAQAGMARLGTAVGFLGRALPIAGVAAIGLGLALSSMSVSTDDAVAALQAGGVAADNMRAALNAQQGVSQAGRSGFDDWANSINTWVNSNVFGIASIESTTAAMEQQEAEMTDLQLAQRKVTEATNEYQQQVNQFTANSPQARAAAAALADAHEQLGQAEQQATELGRSHTEQIQAQADAMRSQISTAFAYEDAVRATAEAHQAAADAMASSGADSEEYRARVTDLARAIDDQAAAAAAQVTALGGAEAGAAAYATEILRATDVSTGPGRDAFVRLAGAMDTAGLAALTSAAEVSGLATEIVTLPDGRTVTVVAAAERSQLDSVTDDLNALAVSKFVGTVTINGDAAPFRDGLLQSVTLANGTAAAITLNANGAPAAAVVGNTKYTIDTTTGVMTIDGNPAPGDANLTGLRVRVDATTGVMSIDGDPSGANQSTQAAVSFADGSTGTITINGNPTTANGQTTAAVRFADGSTGTITVDANQAPANGKVTGVVRYADGSTGTIQIAARDLASPVINRLRQPTSSTHTINVVENRRVNFLRGSGVGGAFAHDGMIAPAQRFRDGGVAATAFAGGGMRPFRAGTAQIFPPRMLRITGDRTDVDEFYIPDNSARRSMSLGAEWARRRGMNLVPKSAETMTMRRGASPAAGPVARQITSVMAQARGTGGSTVVTAPVDLRPLAAELRTFVQAALGRADQAAVVAAVDRLGHALAAPRATSAETHRLFGLDGAL